MKRISNKILAFLLYFAPYLVSVVLVVVYALILSAVGERSEYGYGAEQSALEKLLTYLPFVIAAFVLAYLLRKLVRRYFDLGVIGVTCDKPTISFFPIAIVVACVAFSLCFGLKRAYVMGDEITELGYFGIGKTVTVYSSATTAEYDFETKTYTLTFEGGKEFRFSKDSKAGEEVAKILNI